MSNYRSALVPGATHFFKIGRTAVFRSGWNAGICRLLGDWRSKRVEISVSEVWQREDGGQQVAHPTGAESEGRNSFTGAVCAPCERRGTGRPRTTARPHA